MENDLLRTDSVTTHGFGKLRHVPTGVGECSGVGKLSDGANRGGPAQVTIWPGPKPIHSANPLNSPYQASRDSHAVAIEVEKGSLSLLQTWPAPSSSQSTPRQLSAAASTDPFAEHQHTTHLPALRAPKSPPWFATGAPRRRTTSRSGTLQRPRSHSRRSATRGATCWLRNWAR
jgi:hypothetical protein